MKTLSFLTLMISLSLCSQRDYLETETEHFTIRWKAEWASKKEVHQVKVLSEEIWAVYNAYLGAHLLPKEKIEIVLEGDGYDKVTNTSKIPHVDASGKIHLYRFDNYCGELAHEMVHSFRIYKGFSGDYFLEEGLAEYLSSKLFPNHVGFSRYGFPLTIVAGVWLRDHKMIPLVQLKDLHAQLSMQCPIQTYPIRADFFSFLESRVGKNVFLKFVYDPKAKYYPSYQAYFGKSFQELEALWHSDLEGRLEEHPEATELTQAYLKTHPVPYLPRCQQGVDY